MESAQGRRRAGGTRRPARVRASGAVADGQAGRPHGATSFPMGRRRLQRSRIPS